MSKGIIVVLALLLAGCVGGDFDAPSDVNDTSIVERLKVVTLDDLDSASVLAEDAGDTTAVVCYDFLRIYIAKLPKTSPGKVFTKNQILRNFKSWYGDFKKGVHISCAAYASDARSTLRFLIRKISTGL
jgi:hypothetical protein|tara:strand:+ start:53687 stop:54073 length:387 start_codon:yes stop_codon:yes gene_type:complete